MGDITQAATLTPAEAIRRAPVSQAPNGVCFASLGEVKQVRGLFPAAHLAFMNPVKSREAIRADLKASPYVAHFRAGESGEGGDGVTVVWLA